jgi:hypothetical protein
VATFRRRPINEEKPQYNLPSRPLNYENEEFPNFSESSEDFKHVLSVLPNPIVPEPPKHASYPTPSGWVPPNTEKASKLPYYVLRTRFHNFPIYALEREGTRKLVRIKHIQGDIWVSKLFRKEVFELNSNYYLITSIISRNLIKI